MGLGVRDSACKGDVGCSVGGVVSGRRCGVGRGWRSVLLAPSFVRALQVLATAQIAIHPPIKEDETLA
jgi:hypothetical protein